MPSSRLASPGSFRGKREVETAITPIGERSSFHAGVFEAECCHFQLPSFYNDESAQSGRGAHSVPDQVHALQEACGDGNERKGARLFAPVAASDADFDNVVTGKDFLTWQRAFGGPGSPTTGDANGDGQVNVADYNIWKAQFGGPPVSNLACFRPASRAHEYLKYLTTPYGE
jgi:hypothetical protein